MQPNNNGLSHTLLLYEYNLNIEQTVNWSLQMININYARTRQTNKRTHTLFNTTLFMLSEQWQKRTDNRCSEGWKRLPSVFCYKAEVEAEQCMNMGGLCVSDSEARQRWLDTAQMTNDPGKLLLHLFWTVLKPRTANITIINTIIHMNIKYKDSEKCAYLWRLQCIQ